MNICLDCRKQIRASYKSFGLWEADCDICGAKNAYCTSCDNVYLSKTVIERVRKIAEETKNA